jgi:hypothetical protein
LPIIVPPHACCGVVNDGWGDAPTLLARADGSDRVSYAPAFAADPGDLDFWRDNDTVEVIGLPIKFERSADVKSKVGG